jgi:CelD/BcsL family acetyltransferase involved in cellulose biosynthesis
MKAELITDISRIRESEGEWRALAELRENGFVTPEWFRSWWTHQADSCSPLIVMVRREDGTLAGVMPLVLDASRRPRAIRFGGANLGDHFQPVATEADENAVAVAAMRALEAEGIERHMLLLELVDSEQDWWSQMQQKSAAKRALTEQQHTELPYIPFANLDWEAYLSQRSAKFRKLIRGGERRLRREHDMKMRAATEESLEADLAELFRLHALRFGSHSSFETPGAKEALSDFAAAAQRRGWLRLHLLEVDGATVAAVIGWRLGGSYTSYQGGIDPAWAKRSVGIILEAMTIRSAIEEGAAEYDFLLGTEAYKRRFTTAARPVQTVVLTRAMRPVRLLVAGEARARRVGKSLADRPALGRVVRSLRGVLPTAR